MKKAAFIALLTATALSSAAYAGNGPTQQGGSFQDRAFGNWFDNHSNNQSGGTPGGSWGDFFDKLKDKDWGRDHVSQVPEPETYLLMLAGLAGVVLVARRRRRRD